MPLDEKLAYIYTYAYGAQEMDLYCEALATTTTIGVILIQLLTLRKMTIARGCTSIR
jgi:hypothetical protein